MERKEAIEVIKKNWPDSSFMMLREALETLIPELKESEDERMRKELIELVKETHTSKKYYDLNKMIAWLEKQGEQKPAWSEEDEMIKESIITGLEMLKDGASDKSLIALYNKRIDWLKSLKDRYTWRPSDEQMDNLSRAFNGGTFRTSLLMELYLDLKKLKE